VQARAIAAHYPLSVYIREVALGHNPQPKSHAVSAEAIRALASAGNTLKELTKSPVATADVAAQAQVAIAKILDVIANLRTTRPTRSAPE
jgi:hypothetical protein